MFLFYFPAAIPVIIVHNSGSLLGVLQGAAHPSKFYSLWQSIPVIKKIKKYLAVMIIVMI
jgi:hypothetical protein